MRPSAARAPLRSRSSSCVLRTATAACEENSASSSRSSSVGSMPAAVSITSAPAGPRCTTSGAATMAAPARCPGSVTGTPLAMAAAAADSSAGHDGGGEPALAIGTSRPCSCWNTTQRSASVVSTAPWATASRTRAMMPGRRQRLADREQPLAVARPAAAGQRAADLGAQLVAQERLGQVVEGAALHRVHRGLDRAVRGHDQHGQPGLTGVHRLHQRDAVGRLHAQVEQREVEARPPRRRSSAVWGSAVAVTSKPIAASRISSTSTMAVSSSTTRTLRFIACRRSSLEIDLLELFEIGPQPVGLLASSHAHQLAVATGHVLAQPGQLLRAAALSSARAP